MKILGIETATAVCAASIVKDGCILSERVLVEPHVHSEKLITLIEQSLINAAYTLGDIDGIAVSIGPGSFTGLRIGLSVAKGLAYARNKPLLAIPTLEGLVWNVSEELELPVDALILPLIDARRSEVYAAGFYFHQNILEEALPVQSISLQGLVELIQTERWIIAMGDGAEKFYQFLNETKSQVQSRVTLPSLQKRFCRAAAIGLLGEKRLERDDVADLATLEPFYVKNFYTLIKTQHLPVQ